MANSIGLKRLTFLELLYRLLGVAELYFYPNDDRFAVGDLFLYFVVVGIITNTPVPSRVGLIQVASRDNDDNRLVLR